MTRHDGQLPRSTNRRDPRERDPAFRRLLRRVRDQADANLGAQGWTLQAGYCHLLWPEMQRILREEHGIAWRTPAEMNPDVRFD